MTSVWKNLISPGAGAFYIFTLVLLTLFTQYLGMSACCLSNFNW